MDRNGSRRISLPTNSSRVRPPERSSLRSTHNNGPTLTNDIATVTLSNVAPVAPMGIVDTMESELGRPTTRLRWLWQNKRQRRRHGDQACRHDAHLSAANNTVRIPNTRQEHLQWRQQWTRFCKARQRLSCSRSNIPRRSVLQPIRSGYASRCLRGLPGGRHGQHRRILAREKLSKGAAKAIQSSGARTRK